MLHDLLQAAAVEEEEEEEVCCMLRVYVVYVAEVWISRDVVTTICFYKSVIENGDDAVVAPSTSELEQW